MPHIPRNIQAPYTEDDFWDKWSSETPRMALCIKVTPSPAFIGSAGLPVGITSNTRDMVLPGHPNLVFKSAAGMIPSEISQSFGETATMEFQGLYAANIFTPDEVLSGYWMDGFVEIFSVAWDNPNLGELVLFTGNLAEIEHYDLYFKGEVRGLSARLSQDVGPVTSRSCRVKFRSSQCGFTGTTRVVDSVTYPLELNLTDSLAGFNSLTSVYAELADGDTILNGGVAWTGAIPSDGFFDNGTVTMSWEIDDEPFAVTREIARYTYVPNSGIPDYFFIDTKRPFSISPPGVCDYSPYY